MASTALTVRQREWLAEIDAQQRSGLSQRAWCAQRGIVLGTFAWWKHQLRWLNVETDAAFVDVVVEDATSTVDIVLRRSGHRVVVGNGFDEGLLRRVVTALETS